MAWSQRQRGIAEIILSGIAFGFLGVFGKAAYARGLTPGELLSLRYLVASGILFVAYLLVCPRLLRLPRVAIIKSLILGVLGYAVFSLCFFQALQGLSASLTVLLLYAYPVLVSLGAFFIFREKLSVLAWLALPLCCAGLGLLVWGDIAVYERRALLFGLASALFYSAYILASRAWLRGISPLSSVVYIQAGAAAALSILHFQSFARTQAIIHDAWPVLLGIAIVSTILAMTLFLAGLQKLSSAEASILSTTEPVTGIFAASFFLGETLSFPQMAGAALVLAALILTSWPQNQSRRAKAMRKPAP